MKRILLFLALGLCCCYNTIAVCTTGQVEVTISIKTDDYGSEGYWELIPSGNNCGTGTIFSGGNNGVGCNGGGQQNSVPGGYTSDTTYVEGPWCLAQGDTFDIFFVDDYGDGGFTFTVNINGYPVYSGLTGSGDAPGTRLSFVASPPPANDASCRKIKNGIYIESGSVILKSWIANFGTDTIHSVDLNYMIDNGIVQTTTLSGLNISPFDSSLVSHSIPWNASVSGDQLVSMWTSNPNGLADAITSNDSAQRIVSVGPGIPNIIDDYLGINPVLTVIGNSSDSIDYPRDLDFYPVLTKNELWVVLKSTESSGGKTVKFSNAGQAGQTSLYQKDDNSWHFMSLPSALAFSNNGNFATAPGVYDANHSGGTPFTGPTLWSSDTNIYCHTPPGGNGSHIDMLHQSPYSMGICSEEENIFWVFDENDQEIVRYDFKNDHGPGNSDHSDGIIRRFSGISMEGDPAHEIPSHLVLQKETGMLFFVDTQNGRVIKMDINSGTFNGNLVPYEGLAEYSTWDNVSWSYVVDSGLINPCGIDVIENRLVVSDYATGDIAIYDVSGGSCIELGRVVTGTPGVMGIKIGPDGKIWYVNAISNEVIRIDGVIAGIKENATDNFSVYPNPVKSKLYVSMNGNSSSQTKLKIYDSKGSIVINETISKGEKEIGIDVSKLSSGVYTISVMSDEGVNVKKFVKE